MARDRLPELLKANSKGFSSSSSLYHPAQDGLSETNLSMEALLAPYSEIRVRLSHISDNLETMRRMMQAVNIRNINEKQMDELRCQNLKHGNYLMNQFQMFKADLPAENDYSLEARMKRTLFYGLYQSYINVWNTHEETLQKYEQTLKKNLKMHSKLINQDATEEELENFISNKTTNLFVGNILEETEKERDTLRNLIHRLDELKRLEKSIEDVHALFMRIQTLVIEQSDTLQRVEFHAQQTTISTEKGRSELGKAETLRKKAFKKKIIIICILICVILVLILIAIIF